MRTFQALLAAAVATSLLAAAAIGLLWPEAWDWLWHCEEGVRSKSGIECAMPNVMVLFAPIAVPFLWWQWAWRRHRRSR